MPLLSLQVKAALHGWQYLFIIEGAVPVLLGIIAPFWLASDVSKAWFLSPEERAFAERRMIVDSVANGGEKHKMSRSDFKDAFTDWRIWAVMLSNTLASLSSQGFTIFFPVVVKVSFSVLICSRVSDLVIGSGLYVRCHCKSDDCASVRCWRYWGLGRFLVF